MCFGARGLVKNSLVLMMRFPFLTASLLSLPIFGLTAQEQTAKPEAPVGIPSGEVGPLPPMTNTLEMKFVPVKGTTVLFSEFETRLSEFLAFTKASGYNWSFRPHFEQSSGHPVVGVTRQEAIGFCNWLTETERKAGKIKPNQGYRLPTNDEWSAAAGLGAERQDNVGVGDRLTEQMKFVWGAEWPPPEGAGNFQASEIPGYKDDYPFTAPVGKFKPTAEGLYDLAGNVWEWTWDQKFTAANDGTLRGGSWAYFRRECLIASYVYDKVPSDLRAPTIGFRCVFEDRDHTAQMLASVNAAQRKAEEAKKKELMTKSTVDKDAVKKVIAGTATAPSAALDPKTLSPAKAGEKFKNPLRMEFVPVDGLKTVLVGVTEVTVGQAEAWTKATGRDPLLQPRTNTGSSFPVVNINWDAAVAFCAWLTEQDRANNLIGENARYRLPRDLEWSVAAGLTNESGADPAERHLKEGTLFPWGVEWPPKLSAANIDAPNVPGYSDSFSYTAPVGSMRPSSLGLHDLAGNVSEWCEDPWPGADDEHVIRGGSWISSVRETLLVSARQHLRTAKSRADLGFRCVLDLSPAP